LRYRAEINGKFSQGKEKPSWIVTQMPQLFLAASHSILGGPDFKDISPGND
jgi:hypothetical protein